LVQRPFNLPDTSQIRLTIARYYTPSGRSIQKPYHGGVDAYYRDFADRYHHGELVHADSIRLPDSLKYHTAGGRIVYGGGGIMPDVFLPWDSTPLTDYYLDIRRKNVINPLVGEYVDMQRNKLQKTYPDFDRFRERFDVDDSIMKQFFTAAETAGVKYNEQEFKASESLIKAQIKGLIAQKLWDLTSFYIIANEQDPEVVQAVKLIGDDTLFKKLQP
jgi:carboxyl-terminal processing protease